VFLFFRNFSKVCQRRTTFRRPAVLPSSVNGQRLIWWILSKNLFWITGHHRSVTLLLCSCDLLLSITPFVFYPWTVPWKFTELWCPVSENSSFQGCIQIMPFPLPENERKACFRNVVPRLQADEGKNPKNECDFSKSRSVPSSGSHIHIWAICKYSYSNVMKKLCVYIQHLPKMFSRPLARNSTAI
jgi:hypothetical protein